MTPVYFVYGLCTLTALSCAVLLLRAYAHSRVRLLLWSGLCFIGLTLSNLILILDRVVYITVDLSLWRSVIALVSVLVLVGGLIFEGDA